MTDTHGSNSIAGEKLLSLIERIENLNIDRQVIGEDIREVMKEARALGFEPKILRKLVAIRKQPEADRQEEQALIEAYASSIGLLL
jgi:uncharacterized protein (UPF0335 family)